MDEGWIKGGQNFLDFSILDACAMRRPKRNVKSEQASLQKAQTSKYAEFIQDQVACSHLKKDMLVLLLPNSPDPFRILSCSRTYQGPRRMNIKAICITTGETIVLTRHARVHRVITLRSGAIACAEESRADNWLTNLDNALRKKLADAYVLLPPVLNQIICSYIAPEPLPLMNYLLGFQFYFASDCVEMEIARIDTVNETKDVEIKYIELTDPVLCGVSVMQSFHLSQERLWQHFNCAKHTSMLDEFTLSGRYPTGKLVAFACIQLRKALIAHLTQKLQSFRDSPEKECCRVWS